MLLYRNCKKYFYNFWGLGLALIFIDTYSNRMRQSRFRNMNYTISQVNITLLILQSTFLDT